MSALSNAQPVPLWLDSLDMNAPMRPAIQGDVSVDVAVDVVVAVVAVGLHESTLLLFL